MASLCLLSRWKQVDVRKVLRGCPVINDDTIKHDIAALAKPLNSIPKEEAF